MTCACSQGGILVLTVNFARGLFHRYNTYTRFGIQLIHRHFLLDGQSILVEDHTVTSPFPKPPADQFPADRIFPKSWYYTENGILEPYEYRILRDQADPLEVPTNPNDVADFTSELYRVLAKHNLIGLLGLAALGSEGLQPSSNSILLEKTFHDRNIFTVCDNETMAKNQKEVQTSLWRFAPSQDGLGARTVGHLVCIAGCICGRME